MDAEKIKARLSMRHVVDRYGIPVSRGNYISCPFHPEKTPSLKIYDEPDRGWHCFGCGKGGSVIKFIMLYFRLNYLQALLRLNADFGFSNEPPDRNIERRFRQNRQPSALLNKRGSFNLEKKPTKQNRG